MGAIPAGGKLNPEFCEWLMCWPIGHSGLRPLAMDKSPSVPQWHFAFWLESNRRALAGIFPMND